MAEIEDNFIKAFNNGYLFSKAFPEVSQSILAQNNNDQIEITPMGGILRGFEQNLKEARELFNERMGELKEIENRSDAEKKLEIDRLG
jgi:hypothetical protein